MNLAEELAAKGTHFHQGEVVVYLLGEGCGFQYREGVECPSCMGTHICGKGCELWKSIRSALSGQTPC